MGHRARKALRVHHAALPLDAAALSAVGSASFDGASGTLPVPARRRKRPGASRLPATRRWVHGTVRALLGMQEFNPTCSVEVACLKDVSGGQQLIDYAVALSSNPNIGGYLHWRQKNEYRMADVERLYGDTAAEPGGTCIRGGSRSAA
jgi:hypothetical protein